MNYQNILKKQTTIILVSVIAMVLIIIGTSYSLFMQVNESKDIQVLESGTLILSSTKGNTITTATIPQSDYDGMNTEGYTFSIKNTGTLDCYYTLYISNVASTNPVDPKYIRISIDDGEPATITDLIVDTENSGRFILEVGQLGAANQDGDVITHNIKIWVDEFAPASIIGKKIQLQIDLYGESIEFYRDESGAIYPELYAGLIPIKYDEDTNVVIANTSEEWYNYDDFKWANAILIDQSNPDIKNKYINADNSYKAGTIVDMADILQMYVWIPRYKYKLFNVEGAETTAQMIEVEFENIKTAKSNGTSNAQWLTHPAFTFGNNELNGIWVGKFEPSNTTSDIKIIPNVSSLRSQTIGDMFNASRAIETTAKYGLSTVEVDSRMIKNMEWGAVAYLSQSKYGKYGNPNYTGANKEVYINNSSSYITGSSGGSPNASSSARSYAWNVSTKVDYVKVSGENNQVVTPTVTNDATYPWTLTDGVYKSTTQGIQSSTTNLIFNFTLPQMGELSFDWSVSSENTSYDYLYYTITKDGKTLSDTGTSTKIGGTSYGTDESSLTYNNVTKVLEAGTYTVTFTYRKDSSEDRGTDAGYVKNLNIKYGATYTNTKEEFFTEENGVGASTTGNIYGIYDMSGGAYEYVMGNMVDSLGDFYSSSSGLTQPKSKYYDSYAYGTSSGDYTRGHLGDATKETQGWNSDIASFVYSSYPWFVRGGRYYNGSDAGVFYFDSYNGDALSNYSWRVVLSSE